MTYGTAKLKISFMLSVTNKTIVLSVVMLSVILLNVVMLKVVAPFQSF
jgi:hypothetical protein